MPKTFVGETYCKTCGILFVKRINPDTKQHYCSVSCRRADPSSYVSEWTPDRKAEQSARNSGINNPNFGNRWSLQQRVAQSVKKIKQYSEIEGYRSAVGASNRGKKFSVERIAKMHATRSTDSYRRVHSSSTRLKISKHSREKWTAEFKIRYRKTMESAGLWAPLAETDPYRIYARESNWKGSMVEFFNSAELEKLKSFGFFSKTNAGGYVRDHIVSRKIGFEYKLPPEILRHPANLQFISHSENISKGFKDRRLTTIEKERIINNLLDRILAFTKAWQDQENCVNFIYKRRKF